MIFAIYAVNPWVDDDRSAARSCDRERAYESKGRGSSWPGLFNRKEPARTIRADEIRQAPGFAVDDINGNDGKAPGTVGPVRKVVSDARRQFFVVA